MNKQRDPVFHIAVAPERSLQRVPWQRGRKLLKMCVLFSRYIKGNMVPITCPTQIDLLTFRFSHFQVQKVQKREHKGSKGPCFSQGPKGDHLLGLPLVRFLTPFLGEGSPTKTDHRQGWYPYSNLSTGGPRLLQVFGALGLHGWLIVCHLVVVSCWELLVFGSLVVWFFGCLRSRARCHLCGWNAAGFGCLASARTPRALPR